jgi:hypothetical protein
MACSLGRVVVIIIVVVVVVCRLSLLAMVVKCVDSSRNTFLAEANYNSKAV